MMSQIAEAVFRRREAKYPRRSREDPNGRISKIALPGNIGISPAA